MPTAFSGDLTGQGTQAFSAGQVSVTDFDVFVSILGPRVRAQGPAGHRALKFAGWIQFTNSTYLNEEGSSDIHFFNSEAQDTDAGLVAGGTADGFAYYVSPGTTVHVVVTY